MSLKNKHIAFIIASKNYGGYEVRYLKLAYFLFQKGYKVSILINSNLLRKKKIKAAEIILSNSDFAKHVYEIGYPYILYFQKPIYFIFHVLLKYDAFLFLCVPVLKKVKADLIYTNKQVSSLNVLRDKLDILIAKDFTSPDTVDSFSKNKDYKYLKTVDALLFVSESVEKRFRESLKAENYKGDLPKMFTAPIPFFYPIELGESIPYEDKENLMIFAHRLIDRKNPVFFARLVKKMCQDSYFNEWKFGLFGKGDKEDEVNLILEKEIRNGRVGTGYKNNLNDYLKSSKIFFSLIEPDSFPSQSVTEAMYAANAIVVLDRGNSSFFIENNGLLVKKDEEFIITEIKVMISQGLKEKCENSIKLVDKKLSSHEYLRYLDRLTINL
jgi:hypothetical protein